MSSTALAGLTAKQADTIRKSLLANFMRDWASVSEPEISEHVAGRYAMFRDVLAPWARRATDGAFGVMLEVGSGTGSSTCAFAPHAKQMHAFEICQRSVATAKDRAQCLGFDNITHEQELFGPDCAFIQSGRRADTALLCATLEHMTHEECLSVLRTAWAALNPGGVLIVADTPNRLSVMDLHTSMLPFFHQLPPAIRALYADRSPRAPFAAAAPDFDTDPDLLVRWGCGVSFHEFELAIGPGIHAAIVRDGFEPEIAAIAPPGPEEDHLARAFDLFDVRAHRAFTRNALYFIARKP